MDASGQILLVCSMKNTVHYTILRLWIRPCYKPVALSPVCSTTRPGCRARDQVLLPVLHSQRRLTCQQGNKCEQRHSCIAEGVVKRIPVFAVFAIMVRDDMLKVVSLT